MNTLLCLLALACTAFAIDPDAKRPLQDIITSKGYPCEMYDMVADDGYITTAFRIPHGRVGDPSIRRPAVLLQHGLLDCAFTWVLNYPHQSLAYILADNGYDVWMLNSRGNIYGLRHKTLSHKEDAFWQFTDADSNTRPKTSNFLPFNKK